MNTGTLHEVVDSDGEKHVLVELIGKGGEGTVYGVDGKSTLAVKIFHKTPLAPESLAKFQAMIAYRTVDLGVVAAWPRSIVYSGHANEACGILTPRVNGARHLHELYSAFTRRRHFPQARWHHLVLAARNVAAAFDKLHAAGIVVGDVNQGNVLVDEAMRVRFIDCDSFQIQANDRTFHCPVGTPHFTPPELHGVKLRDVRRSVDNDRFGLAVLIFHLLFVGRHPFAGRYFGDGDLSIERSIAERRFAFSKNKGATLMEPPPASLRLDDLPASIGEMFERAFRQPEGQANRPSASDWVEQLDLLLRQRQSCSFDPAHLYYARLSECPWCRIEDEGGPAFFVLDGSSSIISPKRIEHLETLLRRLTIPSFPPLSPQQLKIPQAIAPKRLKSYGRLSAADWGAAALVGAGAICLAVPLSPWALLGGIGSLASGAFLYLNKDAKSRRRDDDQLVNQLTEEQNEVARKSRAIAAAHAQRKATYDKSVAELKAEAAHYQAADGQLKDVLTLIRMTQQNRFLASHLIQDHIREIPGMTPALAAVLQSYGIESPLDVDSIRLIGVPMLHDGLSLELIAWRDRVARQFTFKTEHGVNPANATAGGKEAVARFKLAQARRILMASRQLDSLAHAHRERLQRELNFFDRSAEPARTLAKNLRDLRTARRPLERAINRSPLTLAAAALAAPVAGALLYWLFG
jgi:DNA-binding helix-hairpin-helix protein with protein kinase domain